MVLFNYSTKELTAKIVYYGPGLCGKTTNLQYIHGNLPDQVKGKMLSLATKTDRTLFFDFLPIDLGDIRGMKTRVQLYTVPGQVFYNETRKLVLKGADGIVFVADSQEAMLQTNLESFKNLEENLKGHAMRLADMPHVIQFNKRDLPRLSSIEDLNTALNRHNAPFYESVATTGIGVQDTLKAIVKLVLLHLTKKYDSKATGADRSAPAARTVVAASPVASPPVVATARAGAVHSIPLSSMASPERETPAPPPSPPASLAPAVSFAQASVRASVTEMPDAELTFDAAEVDVLVDEVQEAPPAWQPLDSTAAWQTDMGVPEEEAPEPWGASGTASLDPLEGLENLASLETMEVDVEELAPSAIELPDDDGDDPWQTAAAAEASFELDRGFDPDWGTEAPPASPAAVAIEDIPVAAAPVRDRLPEPAEAGAEVLLTDTAWGASLFADPDLAVARLKPGASREVQVPVELGEGGQVRKLVLTVRLTLTPVE